MSGQIGFSFLSRARAVRDLAIRAASLDVVLLLFVDCLSLSHAVDVLSSSHLAGGLSSSSVDDEARARSPLRIWAPPGTSTPPLLVSFPFLGISTLAKAAMLKPGYFFSSSFAAAARSRPRSIRPPPLRTVAMMMAVTPLVIVSASSTTGTEDKATHNATTHAGDKRHHKQGGGFVNPWPSFTVSP